jgi:hypothetical protein
MDSRIARIRRKLAKVPYAALRSHSFGEDKHGFRLEPPLPDAKIAEFEADHHIELPDPYRSFLTTLGGGGASPFYGLLSALHDGPPRRARLPSGVHLRRRPASPK